MTTFTPGTTEIVADTTSINLRIGDSSQAGGFPIHKFAATHTTLTANAIVYAASTTTLGVSSNLTWDGSVLAITGTLTTSSTINSQTISSSANFTGTLTTAGIITVTSLTEQLRLKYDNSNYASFTVSNTGNLTIAPVVNGNIGFNQSTFGTSAAKVLAIGSGTAPTTSPSDAIQIWSADRGGTAGKASLHIRTEDGTSHVLGDYVGIGTTSPGYPLHVIGNIAMSPVAGGYRYLLLDNASAGTGGMVMQAGAGSGGFGGAIVLFAHSHASKPGWVTAGISASSGGKFTVNTSGLADGTDVFTVQQNGNVGINTTSPQGLLDVQGAAGAPGILYLATKELTVVDGDKLGQINFNAPLESDGTDAILVAASIWAEADATFSTTVNTTDLVFATGTSETATEKMRLTSAGTLTVSGNIITLATAKTPASATDTGTTGSIAWDTSYIYVCTATNTWRRVAHATW